MLVILACACTDRTLQVANDPAAVTPRSDRRDGGGDSSESVGDGTVATSSCPALGCACNDGLDNDGDDVVDGLDPECTGPFDNDESTFGTGEPEPNAGACLDCFFDGNRSSLDDSCAYDPTCWEVMGPGMASRPNESCDGCEVGAACVNSCRSRTPNGCDCFGCCEVYDKGKKPQYVLLVAGCSLGNINDRKACPRCKQSPDCRNECNPCELCIGKAPEDLEKAACGPDGGAAEYECGDGPVCGKKASCKDGFYCQQGCCIPVLL